MGDGCRWVKSNLIKKVLKIHVDISSNFYEIFFLFLFFILNLEIYMQQANLLLRRMGRIVLPVY